MVKTRTAAVVVTALFWLDASATPPPDPTLNNWPRLSALLADKALPADWRSEEGWSLIYLQLLYGSEDEAVRLLKLAKPTKAWMEGRGRLMSAAATRGSQQVVKALLARGESPNTIDPVDASPLMYAAWHGQLGVMRLLIKAGADINYNSTDRDTAFSFAIKDGQIFAARLLVDSGFNLRPYRYSHAGAVLIDHTINSGHPDMLRLLFELDFSPKAPPGEEETYVTYAVKVAAKKRIVEEPIENDVNACEANTLGQTPLSLFSELGPMGPIRRQEYGSLFAIACRKQ
jgi:hypothetical protein